MLISYADRTNMSLTVLEMMRELGLVDPKTNIVEPDKEGILLAAFFCGYIVTQVPGGWAAQVWGGRRVLAVGSVVWSVCTFLIPLATTAGFWWVVLLRVGLGLGEGVCFPSIHVLVSRWVPESEKSRAVAIITAGAYLGNIVAIGVSGELIRSPYFGWRYAFYIFGIFGLVWNFGWHFFARHEHEHIAPDAVKEAASDNNDEALPPDDVGVATAGTSAAVALEDDDHGEERLHHAAHRRQATADVPVVEVAPSVEDRLIPATASASTAADAFPTRIADMKVPWKKLLLNRSAFAILVNFFCYSWGFYVLVSWLPTYFERWDVNPDDVSWFVIAPYVVQGLVGVLIGFLADYLVLYRRWSLLAVRQLAQGIGMFGPAVALFVAAYGVDSALGGMITMTVAMGLSSCTVVGHSLLQHDIAPQWAGVMFAVGNMVATIPGIVGVASSGWLLEAFNDNWAAPLTLAAAFHLVGGIVWVLFARTKPLDLS